MTHRRTLRSRGTTRDLAPDPAPPRARSAHRGRAAPRSRIRRAVVDRCLAAILLPGCRRRGRLTVDAIHQLTTWRGLKPAEIAHLWVGLRERGVEVAFPRLWGEADPRAPRDARPNAFRTLEPRLVDELPPSPLAGPEDRLRLARRYRVARTVSVLEEASLDRVPDLGRCLRAGFEARDVLVRHQLPRIARMARYVASQGSGHVDELFQVGVVCLFRALDGYDPDHGTALGAYSYRLILRDMWYSQLLHGTCLELSADAARRLLALREAQERILQDASRPPGVEELAERAGISHWRVAVLLAVDGAVPLRDGIDRLGARTPRGRRLIDEDGPERRAEQRALADLLEDLIADLPPRQRYVLRRRQGLYGGEPQTLDAIAATLGLSRERVRQIESAARARLGRRPSVRRRLEAFLT